MKTLETPRLLLRKFTPDDFDAGNAYASVRENVLYMPWGPNSEDDTRNFINMAIARADENPCHDYQYAVTLKDSGRLIGGCCLTIKENETGELGWILHRDWWKQGYGPELGEVLLELGFGELGLHRITANCDAENYGSYRVMEKIGMRREGLFIEGRAANKLTDKKYSDSLLYAILHDEWETQREIKYYNALPCHFEGFVDMLLSDCGLELVCTDKKPAEPERKYVPAYVFEMQKNGERVGEINLRLGYTDGLYYGGQIGYSVNEPFRGYGYAGAACRMAAAVARAHGMTKLLITNEVNNTASRRVCEKLGARLVRVARLPEWHDLYKDGHRFVNIFEWSI